MVRGKGEKIRFWGVAMAEGLWVWWRMMAGDRKGRVLRLGRGWGREGAAWAGLLGATTMQREVGVVFSSSFN